MTARKVKLGDREVEVTSGPDQRPGEVVKDINGNVVDDAYIARAVEQVDAEIARNKGGRPSLDDGQSPHNPALTVGQPDSPGPGRMPPEVAAVEPGL